MIVMGGHNKKVEDFIFGSDIFDVIHKARCPILILPEPA